MSALTTQSRADARREQATADELGNARLRRKNGDKPISVLHNEFYI